MGRPRYAQADMGAVQREVQLLQQVHHPNVVELVDVQADDEYIVRTCALTIVYTSTAAGTWSTSTMVLFVCGIKLSSARVKQLRLRRAFSWNWLPAILWLSRSLVYCMCLTSAARAPFKLALRAQLQCQEALPEALIVRYTREVRCVSVFNH